MTNNTTVQPGEQILPRITAEWFNNTLQNPDSGRSTGVGAAPRRPSRIQPNTMVGAMYCPYTGSEKISRFNPVHFDEVTNVIDDMAIGPMIQGAPADFPFHWGVLQEDAIPGGCPLVVWQGFTRAIVHGLAPVPPANFRRNHAVCYNPLHNHLETCFQGRAQVMKDLGLGKALIFIGPGVNTARVKGNSTEPIPARIGPFIFDTLKGIDGPIDNADPAT